MIDLPQQISIYGLSINTFGVFLMFGLLLFIFVVWSEGKKDGFDEERLLDLVIISLVLGILSSRAVFGVYNSLSFKDMINHIYKVWETGYSLNGAIVGVLIPILYLSNKWRWSIYRILDVFALATSLALSVIFLSYVGLQGKFEFLFGFSALIFLFALLSKFRNSKIKSGYGFSMFLAIVGILTLIFFRNIENLIFYLLLVTLSSVVFIFRWRTINYESKFIGRFIKRFKATASGQKRNF